MASWTLLNLVNRVRRRLHLDDTQTITKPRDLAIADSLNLAVQDILTSYKWDFDLRKDGVLNTLGYATSNTVNTSIVNNFVVYGVTPAAYTILGGTIADGATAGPIHRLIVTGDTEYADTAVRIQTWDGTNPVASTTNLTTGFAWPNANTGATATIFYSEYVLPETVRDVVRVTYQEEDLTLEEIGATVQFEEMYPRPSWDFGEPESVSVGGYDTRTYDSSDETAPDAGLRMVVYPPPDDVYMLQYTYYYRHPVMSATTDTLDGVPSNVVNKIVEYAEGDVRETFEKDRSGFQRMRHAMDSADELHRAHGGQTAKRRPFHSFDRRYSGVRVEYGFPGKVLGS